MSALNRAIIHHTAGSGDYNVNSISDSKAKVRAVQNIHMDINGWSDIGYHFLFDKLGNSFEGRRNSINKSQRPRGAHDGVNTNSFGFSNLGYYHPPYNHVITQAQKDMMYDVIAWRMPDGYSPYGEGSYGGNTVGYLDGHRDARATACPGDTIYNTIIGTNHFTGEARDEINARIQGTGGQATIIDNQDAEFSTTGSWGTSSGSGYYNNDSLYSFVGGATDTATWAPGLDLAQYDVYAWWVAGSNRSSNAVYQVNHAGGTSNIAANQTTNGGQWNLLGNFTLDSNSNVVIEDTGNGAVVSADAIRFVYTGAYEEIVDNSDSGFATTGSWGASSGSGFYGTNSLYALTGGGADSATWSASLPTASYDVYAWWVSSSNRSPDAVYQINHLSGTSNIPANQTANGGQWNFLGTYAFDSNANVVLTDAGSGAVVSADAIRFVQAGPAEFVVDNTDSDFTASSNWFDSTSVSGYLGSNYKARATEATGDAATWKLNLQSGGSYEVFARWTAGSNRASSAPYIVYHSGGSTTVTADQTQNNGTWVSLGTYTFSSGLATRVALSCWTSSGDYVIADAIKLVPQ